MLIALRVYYIDDQETTYPLLPVHSEQPDRLLPLHRRRINGGVVVQL